MADHDTPQASKVARDAALQSLVSNAVYLALMLGITVAIAKRDALLRLRLRLERTWRQDTTPAAHRRALAEFRRDLSQIEHWMNRGPDSPPEAPGGMYGQR